MNQPNDADPSDRMSGHAPVLDPLDEALRWLLALQAADGDQAIRREFDTWRTSDRRRAAAYARVSGLWQSAEFGEAVRRTEPALTAPPPNSLVRLQPRRAHWGRRVAAMAAVLALAVGVAQFTGLTTRWRADHVTATGEQRTVTLSDGSTVRLNSGSAIAVDFNAGHRTVRLLEGEAFFDVVRDPARPFRVSGLHAEVEVTGTAFAVRSESAVDDVAVQHGRVLVAPSQGGVNAVALSQLQSIAVGDGKPSAVRTIDADTAFAWLEGRIKFRDRSLGQVLDELSRYHRGAIVVADSRFKDMKVTGNYRLDQPVVAVASLADAVGARLIRVSDCVLILR